MAKLSEKIALDMGIKNKSSLPSSNSFDSAREFKETLEYISLKLIVEKSNIRENFNEEDLIELSQSLLEVGQLEPCVVSPTEDGFYELQLGHRRFRSAQIAQLPVLQCIVRKPFNDEEERLIKQMIENEQRQNLSPSEKEAGIIALKGLGLSSTDIAKKLGKTKGWVSQIEKAYEFRNSPTGQKLSKEEIELSSYDAYNLNKLKEDEIDEIIDELTDETKSNEQKKNGIRSKIKEKTGKSKNKSEEINTEEISNEETFNIDIIEGEEFVNETAEEEKAGIDIEYINNYLISNKGIIDNKFINEVKKALTLLNEFLGGE